MWIGLDDYSCTLFFSRAKVILGQCYKVADVPRGVFLRVLMLFSLTTTALDDDLQAAAQAQLYVHVTHLKSGIFHQITILLTSRICSE